MTNTDTLKLTKRLLFCIIACFTLFLSCSEDEIKKEEQNNDNPSLENNNPNLKKSETFLLFTTDARILRSENNGKDWTETEIPESGKKFNNTKLFYNDGIYYNGKWLVVGGFGNAALHKSLILSSEDDGKTWNEINNPGQTVLNKIYKHNDIYIACGDNAQLLTSSDGLTWDKIDISNAINCKMRYNLKYISSDKKNNIIVIAGSRRYYENGQLLTESGFQIESLDGGKTWSNIDYDIIGQSLIEGLCFGDDKFISLGVDRTYGLKSNINTRKDGKWTSESRSNKMKIVQPIIYSKDKFIAIGDDKGYRKITKFDGENWVSVASLDFNSGFDGILKGENKILIYGSEGMGTEHSAIYMSDNNGDSWNNITGEWENSRKIRTKFVSGGNNKDNFVLCSYTDREIKNNKQYHKFDIYYTKEDGTLEKSNQIEIIEESGRWPSVNKIICGSN